ncbi:transcriptional regulator, TetR family [Pseudomonas cuatrocienegasensis]|uniref:Transcriptional regulator, TetR family n=1 Tax=Pseudomonas cuatrocienegasensis TaxID=543360 RepID=A0ABY1BPN0_9PSED|nr:MULTISPECIES: TetR/AcrR family transcriptional regulator [Pseudomonas]OEC33764.1 transcriptional regulator [Pseudomonas sp. 21C1]SER32000.1 transcriptional regulator, TetR family [Pseudomonas cuatrocienegasensis]
MTTKAQTSRPPKQPDQVRKRLFQAATVLLSTGQPVSIGAIASAAGVSKGAVQHHFGTKEQLLAALFDLYMDQFNEALALEDASAPPALRYARMSLNTTSYQDTDGWRAMVVATVVDRGLAARWSERAEIERSMDQSPSANALLVRLAADGLWLSDLLSTYKVSNKEREELDVLMRELLRGS